MLLDKNFDQQVIESTYVHTHIFTITNCSHWGRQSLCILTIEIYIYIFTFAQCTKYITFNLYMGVCQSLLFLKDK